jgi:integrase
MKLKITKSSINGIPPTDGKPVFYYDTELKGFGIKANPTRKIFFVEKRVNGKTVRSTIAPVGAVTPEQARKLAQEQLGIMATGVNTNQKTKNERIRSITLEEIFNNYIEVKNITPKTKVEYARALNNTFGIWKNRAIGTINRDMVEKRFAETTTRSPSVANADFRFLRALINFAMEKYTIDGEPLIPSNPCNRLRALKLWNRVERRSTYIRPAQIKSFFHGLSIDALDTNNMRSAKNQCMLILFTGCREQEAARLKWKNVNFEEKTLTFEITKNHKKHILPLGDWLMNFIGKLYCGQDRESYLFPANNKTGHIKDHRRLILKIAENCGVKFTLHDIRRTFASIVDHDLGQSFSPYTLKRLLNHSSQDVTSGYIQFGVEDLRKPMQMVEDFILVNAGVKEETGAEIISLSEKRGKIL